MQENTPKYEVDGQSIIESEISGADVKILWDQGGFKCFTWREVEICWLALLAAAIGKAPSRFSHCWVAVAIAFSNAPFHWPPQTDCFFEAN